MCQPPLPPMADAVPIARTDLAQTHGWNFTEADIKAESFGRLVPLFGYPRNMCRPILKTGAGSDSLLAQRIPISTTATSTHRARHWEKNSPVP